MERVEEDMNYGEVKEMPEDMKKFYSIKDFVKCPFRKIVNKLHEKTDGIGDSFRDTIQEEEKFLNCIGHECMAFRIEENKFICLRLIK